MSSIWFTIAMALLTGSAKYKDAGALSVYWPGDGWNSGKLCCGGQFSAEQEHIAYRAWWRVGCKSKVVVCATATRRCVLTSVQDAGPFGIVRGPLRNAYAEGRWKTFTGPGRPPKGWRYRAVADLSRALWRKLGSPPGLSQIKLYFVSKATADAVASWLRRMEELESWVQRQAVL